MFARLALRARYRPRISLVRPLSSSSDVKKAAGDLAYALSRAMPGKATIFATTAAASPLLAGPVMEIFKTVQRLGAAPANQLTDELAKLLSAATSATSANVATAIPKTSAAPPVAIAAPPPAGPDGMAFFRLWLENHPPGTTVQQLLEEQGSIHFLQQMFHGGLPFIRLWLDTYSPQTTVKQLLEELERYSGKAPGPAAKSSPA